MPIDCLSAAAGQHRSLEAELADAGAHPIDNGVVLSRIAGVQDKAINWPDLDFEWCARFCRLHADISTRVSAIEILRKLHPRRRPANRPLEQFYQRCSPGAHLSIVRIGTSASEV